tara:strand:- start:30254 stop:30856 length:603 start_codon:yes stop_codon:yes gene_type:complete
MWEVTYSDGNTKFGINNIIVYETRCIQCQNIIRDVGDLPALQVKPLMPFWRNWFVKQEEYLLIPHASIDVYLELFDNTAEVQEKRNWAVKAYRLYNQNFLMFGKERIARVEMQHRYREMTDFLLAHPPTPIYEEYNLLCADIYRLRGDFSRCKKIYDTVIEDKFEHVVEQGRRWCDSNNASLMAIKEYTQQSQIKEANEA